MNRRNIKPRELLAVHPDHIRREPGAMWWDSGIEVPPNEQIGTVCVVHVRGALEHHHCRDADSYDDIRTRVHDAMCNEESRAVVLCLDTPGGVVSGLNETVAALRKMAEEHGKPLIAHVDGLCASAGYALSCSCSEFYLTNSAITGSVGVISMIVSQERADKKAGIDVVTIKSGARKDDGHVHVPISADAVDEEQRRVDKLAQQFFRIVSRARGLSPAKVQSFQAGIFLGKEAVKSGLADAVLSLDALLGQLNDGGVKKKVLAPVAQPESTSTTKNGTPSAKRRTGMTLNALIRQTKAALAKEKDPKKAASLATALASFTASLEAAKRVKKVVKYEMESTDEGDEDEAAEEEAAEEESEESEKGNETDRKEGDDDSDDGGDDDGDSDDDEAAEEEEEAEEAEEAEEEEERMAAKGKRAANTSARVTALEMELKRLRADTERRNTKALIDEARAARRITPGEAKQLAKQPRAVVKALLAMRKKPLVTTDDDSLIVPDGRPGADLPAAVLKQIDTAVTAANCKTPEDAAKLREALMTDHRKQRAVSNGAGRF